MKVNRNSLVNSAFVFSNALLVSVLFSACKTKGIEKSSSEVKIVGGEKTSEYTYVVKLVMDPLGKTNSEQQAMCTGIFIDKTTVLTSSHCLQEKDQGAVQPTVVFEVDGSEYTINSKAVFGYRDLVGKKQIPIGLSAYDIALIEVVCDENSCPQKGITFPKISGKAPAKDDKVTLVGYGASNLDSKSAESGVKRAGKNQISSVTNNIISVVGEESKLGAQHAIATYGDSGGPLLDSDGNLMAIGSSFNRKNGEIKNYFSPLSGSAWNDLLREYKYKTRQFQGGSKGFLFDISQAEVSGQLNGEKAESMFLFIPVIVGAAIIAKSKFVSVSVSKQHPTDVTVNTKKGGDDVSASTKVTVNAPFSKTQVDTSSPSSNVEVNTNVAQVNVRSQKCGWFGFFLVCK